MNNDVLLVPINVEQPNVETQSDVVVYVPQAHKNKAGIVKEGDGINIENGVVSLNKQTVEDMIDANKWVSYGFEQNLTEDEKGIARHNIGAGDNDFTGSWLDLANRPQTTVDFAENERKKSKNFFDVNTFLSKSTHTTVNENVIAQAGGGLGELSSVWGLIPVSMFYSQQSGIAPGYAQFFMNIMTTGDRIVIFRFYDKNKNLVVPTTTPMFWRYDNNYKGVYRLYYNEDVVGNINLNDLDPNDGIEYIAFCTSRRASSQTISNVMITTYNDVGELSDYQPYYGQISRKGDSEIRFAETEHQKSKNLWANGDITGTLYKDVKLGNPLPAGTYTMSGVITSSDTGWSASLIALYSGNTLILELRPNRNTRFAQTFTTDKICTNIYFYASGNYSESVGDTFSYTDIMITTDGSSDYQPYHGPITHNGDASVVFAENERKKSKNLLCLKYSGVSHTGITVTTNAEEQTITINGTTSAYGDWLANKSNVLPIIKKYAGKRVTMSVNVVSGSATGGALFALCFSDDPWYDNWAATAVNLPKDSAKATKTFVVPSDKAYDSIRLYADKNVTFDNFVVKFQIEDGDAATDWTYPSGAITHNNDAPVVFAESERQKSKNLFNINDKILRLSSGVEYSISDDTITITTAGEYVAIKLVIPANTQVVFSWEQGHTVKLYNEKVTTWLADLKSGRTYTNDTDEDLICALVMYGEGAYSKLQVEKGSVVTDYQPYNGAIVHEKDIADVEHVEVIYDKDDSTKNIINGVAYTSGLLINNTSYPIDFNKYKRVYVIGVNRNVPVVSVVDFTTKTNDSFYYGSGGMSYNPVTGDANQYYLFMGVQIALSKSFIGLVKDGYNTTVETGTHSVVKIVGVY